MGRLSNPKPAGWSFYFIAISTRNLSPSTWTCTEGRNIMHLRGTLVDGDGLFRSEVSFTRTNQSAAPLVPGIKVVLICQCGPGFASSTTTLTYLHRIQARRFWGLDGSWTVPVPAAYEIPGCISSPRPDPSSILNRFKLLLSAMLHILRLPYLFDWASMPHLDTTLGLRLRRGTRC